MNRLTACALALALAAPALAHAESVTSTIAVSSAGLDLGQAADARLMLRRLDHAALKVCGASRVSVEAYKDAVRRSVCYRDGMSQAVASLDAPLVSSLHAAYAPLTVAAR